jgi:far upstream element-binding protein
MSTTAEEALSRAKAIAARLSGNDSTNGGGDAAPTTTKRKRWGVAPAIVAAVQETLPGLDAAKRAKTSTDQNTSKRIWVPTTKERPVSHFFSFFSSRLEEITDKVNAENPAAQEKVKVELKGRGSSNRPPLPGIPEEPMHVVISGPDDLILTADTLLDALISEAEKAPVECAPADESAQKNSLALTTNNSLQSSYRPATVAQLISNNPVLNNDMDNLMEEAINVPNGVVGFLIGRGGETISSMQARSGCKIQIQKEHELQPGQTHRVITLQAATQDSIDQCRGMIESMVQDRIRAAGGGTTTGSKDLKVNEAVAAGHRLVEVKVPDADVGLIIGKGGSTIKHIQDTTGASIQIPPSGNLDDPSVRTVSVTHPTEEGARMAKHQIEELLKSKPSFSKDQGQQLTLQILVSTVMYSRRNASI